MADFNPLFCSIFFFFLLIYVAKAAEEETGAYYKCNDRLCSCAYKVKQDMCSCDLGRDICYFKDDLDLSESPMVDLEVSSLRFEPVAGAGISAKLQTKSTGIGELGVISLLDSAYGSFRSWHIDFSYLKTVRFYFSVSELETKSTEIVGVEMVHPVSGCGSRASALSLSGSSYLVFALSASPSCPAIIHNSVFLLFMGADAGIQFIMRGGQIRSKARLCWVQLLYGFLVFFSNTVVLYRYKRWSLLLTKLSKTMLMLLKIVGISTIPPGPSCAEMITG